MFGSLFSFFLFACSEVTPSQTLSEVESSPSKEAAYGTGVVEAGLPSDFPAEKDWRFSLNSLMPPLCPQTMLLQSAEHSCHIDGCTRYQRLLNKPTLAML